MRRPHAVLAPVVVALGYAVAVAVLFVSILYAWGAIDRVLATREVSRFLRDHQALVQRRLRDPKVHAFALSHHPDYPDTLLIRVDVDDKATYEMLESDLNAMWGLSQTAMWETTIRSKEDLGIDLGLAARGIGLVYEAVQRMLIVAVISLVVPGIFVIVGLLRLRARQRANDGVTHAGVQASRGT